LNFVIFTLNNIVISVCYPSSTVTKDIADAVNGMLNIPGGEGAFNDL